jgi:hypothetical protein
MQRGDTFLMPAGPQGFEHLWIFVTDPDTDTNEAVIVSVTTLRNAADQTVILRRGDHGFIRHDSAVYFGDARIIDATKVDSDISEGRLRAHDPCSATLIGEIASGLLCSSFTPKKILTFLRLIRHP